MAENWRPIAGHAGYEVSDCGQVRSVDRTIQITGGQHRTYKGRVLKQQKDRYGYPRITLPGAKAVHVHRLVLEAFIGQCPPGAECRHINDDRTNNSLSNLAWGTRVENRQDMVRNGRHHLASRTECLNGHPFNAANTYVDRMGRRCCRVCGRDRQRKVKAARKAAA